MPRAIRKILVTGATGYIGGRLVPRLIERGYSVRCLTRHPDHLQGRGWQAEIVAGDALSRVDLARAMEGVDAAYYLIHSMADHRLGGARLDIRAALRFARAARAAGVERIVYLGGLGAGGKRLSRHLRSRQKVGEILRKEGPSVTEFRAAVIVGSGSVSFEMIRYIVDRMPVIPLFPWLRTRCQPIAVRDVLSYLIMALEVPESAGRIIEIGGGSVMTYHEMMSTYARRRGLRRFFVPFPRLPTVLSAAWVEMTSPIPANYARPLIEGLADEVVCREPSASALFPIKPLDYETAVRYALLRIEEGTVETTWSMALFPEHSNFRTLASKEGLIGEERTLSIHASARATFSVFSGIGGDRGWFYMDFLWVLRAWIDRCLRGVGMRRGRRNPDALRQGEPLDFWRVEKVIEGRLILLRAEMRLPGRAWLEFESIPQTAGRCLLRQAAYFEPRGLLGYLYWYALYPFHQLIFAGLVREIAKRAKAEFNSRAPSASPRPVAK